MASIHTTWLEIFSCRSDLPTIQHLGGGYDTIAHHISTARLDTRIATHESIVMPRNVNPYACMEPVLGTGIAGRKPETIMEVRPRPRFSRPGSVTDAGNENCPPDASAADRGSSGGDLGPARFRVSSQIALRMILAHRRVVRIPWMPPRGHHRRGARDLARRFVTLGNRRRIQLA